MARTIGTIKCFNQKCGREVAVGETTGGNLTCRCQFCGLSPYAPPGSKAARDIRAAMVPFDDGNEQASAPAKPEPSEARPAGAPPVKRIPTSAFDLGSLA